MFAKPGVLCMEGGRRLDEISRLQGPVLVEALTLAFQQAHRNLSMTLRHLLSEFSVAPHRSVTPASVC
jgi:hypothetical protein